MMESHPIFLIVYFVSLFFSISIMTYYEIDTTGEINVKMFTYYVILGLIPVINIIISVVMIIAWLADNLGNIGDIVLYRKCDKD